MSRVDEVTFEFVDLLPKELADGVLYISLEHRTVVHKCCSGCDERVVIGLSPAQWKLTFDGETISLYPSIGNGALPCNSHYWIRENKVLWAKPLTSAQTRRSQRADRADSAAHYAQREPNRPSKWNLIARVKAYWRSKE